MRPLRWVVIALPMAAVLLAPALAPGARIVTKSHQTFTGTITEETAQAITIATDSGKVTVPVTTIASIQRDTVPGEEPKIVPAPIKAAKAPEAFQNAKAAISAGDWVKAGGLLAGGFGPHGVKVHEPGFEDGPGHFFQGTVHAPVQLDLVVQCTQDVGNGLLFFQRRDK